MDKISVGQNQSLEDLGGGFFALQYKDKYRFTCDAVALANFVKVKKNEIGAEFGSGCGIISLLLCQKYCDLTINALEIQQEMADLTRQNAQINNISHRMNTFCEDAVNAYKILGAGSMDFIVCNPPYRKRDSGMMSLKEEIQISRHEVYLTLEQMVFTASRTLKYRGRFYFIHQAERLEEIILALNKYNLRLKELQPICPNPKKQPHLVLIEAVLGGNLGVKIKNPLIITSSETK